MLFARRLSSLPPKILPKVFLLLRTFVVLPKIPVGAEVAALRTSAPAVKIVEPIAPPTPIADAKNDDIRNIAKKNQFL